MKKIILVLIVQLACIKIVAQSYEGLVKIDGISQKVYFSDGSKNRAMQIAEEVAKAEVYFTKNFTVQPQYTLLILSKTDWQKFAHPNAIYGIPHYLPDGRLVVASENNEFWKRSLPPLETLPKDIVEKIRNVYTDEKGEISLKECFDLLAIHELGHAFQNAAKMNSQRNWMNELLCNILLHTYVAENNPKLLPALTLLPEIMEKNVNPSNLKYTKLEDFETYYNEIAQKHPDNYGWYQCKFHNAAAQIYNSGGADAMKQLWTLLLDEKTKLSEEQLNQRLSRKAPKAVNDLITNWNKESSNNK